MFATAENQALHGEHCTRRRGRRALHAPSDAVVDIALDMFKTADNGVLWSRAS